MIRVLHVQKLAGIGGAEKHLSLLLPALVKGNIEVHYLALEPAHAFYMNQPLIEQLQASGVQCHRITLRHNFDGIALWKFYILLKNINPGLLHTHLIQGDFYGALLKYILPGMKLISTKHGYDEDYQAHYGLNPEHIHRHKNLYYYLSRFSVRKADRIITISLGLREIFIALTGTKEKIQYISYAYPQIVLPEIKIAKHLLYVGRLIPFKHPELLLQAYKLYRQKGGCLPLIIAGGGSMEPELKAYADQTGLSAYIQFRGRIPQPEELLPEAAVLCVSSLSEGFGLVMLEAMAAGIPVLGFDAPAMHEVILHKKTGLLCKPADVNAFAEAMLFFEQNPEERANMGKNGFDYLQSEFSMQKMVSACLHFYTEISGV